MSKTFTMIDLFCGAGGMTCGFVNAGFIPIFAVERTPTFAATYEANFGCHVVSQDIESLNLKKLPPKADVVIGGPPCQGFSNLGPNDPHDPRRALWEHYMDVVETSGCKVFLMENVPNILASNEGDAILKRAAALGFAVTSGVLVASKFGVPQNRKRAFIIGSKLGAIQLPVGSAKKVTVRQAFRGIPRTPLYTELQGVGPYKTSDLHIGRNPTELSRKRYALIPPGGNRFDLQRAAPELTPECWLKKQQGGTDIYGRIHWDEPARCTIRTEFYKPEKGRFLHPEEDRPITHWEAARLQSFPDDFLWHGTKIEIAIQIGNAVPPKLAAALAVKIHGHIAAVSMRRRVKV